MTRQRRIMFMVAMAWLVSCSGGSTSGEGGNRIADFPANKAQDKSEKDGKTAQKPTPPKPPPPPPDPLRPQPDLAPDKSLIIVIDGKERRVDRAAALEAGYTVIDLRDTWTPYIFKPFLDADGEVRLNRYRPIFVGLANDETDGDGRKLPKNEKNFLEVFGIPPSLGVIRDRTVSDAESECHQSIDYELIASLDRIKYRSGRRARKHRYKITSYRRKFKRYMKKKKVANLDALAEAKPKWAKQITYLKDHDHEQAVFAEIEKRLTCDNHNHKRYRHKTGKLDQGLALAVRRFQRKHMIYEWHRLRRRTMQLMGMHHNETNFIGLKRALTERIISATGILEDGSVKKQTGKVPLYRGKDGQMHPIRNLAEEFVNAALKQLNIDTPQKAIEFFKRHPREDFEWLQVGIKFPKKPEYYSAHMDLEFTIDRGTIWYDFPYKESGKPIRQKRKNLPKAVLSVNYDGQRIPIVYWPTTIGGWRKDLAPNGYTYLKYKGSDVGERVIRKIIAGPSWIAPPSTPLKSLVKRKWINGKGQNIINYDEMGPGYLSAFGLVAGYFVKEGKNGRGDVDRGIRAHGSSNYMSIRSSRQFSHGCHRLMNHHAVRLYGFVLNHRTHRIAGDQKMNYERQFLYKDQVYQVRVPSRGFQYVLDPPLPVNVLEGEIEGEAKKPLEGYFKIPGEEYPAEIPSEDGKKDAKDAKDAKEETKK